jgi:two-component system, cell cycle response regulator
MEPNIQSPGVRPRILFVDDSKLMRLSGRKILAEQFDIVLAEDAVQATTFLSEDPTIQLVFSDLNMPGKSGYELIDELRSSEQVRLRELPVIIITGTDDLEQERRKALELGATDFISKPFRASELLARAQTHASHKEAVRRLRMMQQQHPVDPATGLGNRQYCIKRLSQAISFAHRHQQPLSMIHLHLSGLDELLTELGEPFSSQAMQHLGQVLRRSIRQEDSIFRTGPNSFCFMLPATDTAGAEVLQQRFIPDLEALGLSREGGALNVHCRFSVQSPRLDQAEDAEAILALGMSEHDASALPPTPAPRPASSPDLEQALAMIESGQFDELAEHLPQLLKRLEPLLALVGHDQKLVAQR